MPGRFTDLFERHLEDADIPFSISGVRHAEEPMYSVARGGLVAARSDEDETVDATPATDAADSEPSGQEVEAATED
jgi:hypothetical protein